MRFSFDERKATQAAVHVLKRAGGSMNAYHLLKIIYYANRVSLIDRGLPLTGDELKDLPDGPAPQNTYDLLKGHAGYWGEHVSVRDGQHQVSVLKDAGDGALSEYETGMLDGLADRFGRLTHDEMKAEAHRWPEHTEMGSGARVIAPEDLLRIGSYTEEEIRQAQASAEEFGRLDHPEPAAKRPAA